MRKYDLGSVMPTRSQQEAQCAIMVTWVKGVQPPICTNIKALVVRVMYLKSRSPEIQVFCVLYFLTVTARMYISLVNILSFMQLVDAQIPLMTTDNWTSKFDKILPVVTKNTECWRSETRYWVQWRFCQIGYQNSIKCFPFQTFLSLQIFLNQWEQMDHIHKNHRFPRLAVEMARSSLQCIIWSQFMNLV